MKIKLKYTIATIPFVALCILQGYIQSKPTQTQKKTNHKSHSRSNNTMTLQTTASGLHYQILHEGSGNYPKTGQRVTVHYTGWLDENGQPGRKFDSSVDRGTPFSFNIGIGHVIKGWDEGVAMMKVGEKRRLIIPASLGYGSRGAGGIIPGNATLIFDVELLSIG